MLAARWGVLAAAIASCSSPSAPGDANTPPASASTAELSASVVAPAPELAPPPGLFGGDPERELELARGVAQQVMAGETGAGPIKPPSARLSGEWQFATHQFAAVGLAQVIAAQPAAKDELLPALRRAAAQMVSTETLAFASAAWRGETLPAAAESKNGHAYLGYAALALCLERAVDPSSPRAELAKRLSGGLAARVRLAPNGVFETYPGETYPPDMAVVYGAIGLCRRVFQQGDDAELTGKLALLVERFVDPASGLLVQRVDASSGRWLDKPRSSGTALAAFALSFVDARLAKKLDDALVRQTVELMGRAGVAEYPDGVSGSGDADSGELVMGVSPVATAFAIGSARLRRDEARYRSLLRTADAFGAPETVSGRRYHRAGGPLADSTLLAMTTAGPFVSTP